MLAERANIVFFYTDKGIKNIGNQERASVW